MEDARIGSRKALLGAVLATLVVLLSCNEPSPTLPLDEGIVQGVLFHGAYTNWAWSMTDRGLYIDREGHVWRMSSSIRWDLDGPFEGRQDTASYPAADLDSTYQALGDSLVAVVDSAELAEKFALIPGAAEGAFSPGEKPGADQGILILGCLVYDPGTEMYRRVVLSVTGDWRVQNLSPEAQELAAWLSQIWMDAWRH